MTNGLIGWPKSPSMKVWPGSMPRAWSPRVEPEPCSDRVVFSRCLRGRVQFPTGGRASFFEVEPTSGPPSSMAGVSRSERWSRHSRSAATGADGTVRMEEGERPRPHARWVARTDRRRAPKQRIGASERQRRGRPPPPIDESRPTRLRGLGRARPPGTPRIPSPRRSAWRTCRSPTSRPALHDPPWQESR